MSKKPLRNSGIGILIAILLTSCTPGNESYAPKDHKIGTTVETTTTSPTTAPTPKFGQGFILPSDIPNTSAPKESLTQEELNMLETIMAVNSFAQLQDEPIKEIQNIDEIVLGTYLAPGLLKELTQNIKNHESKKVFDRFAIHVQGLEYQGSILPRGRWVIEREANPTFEKMDSYPADGFNWEAVKVTITRKVVVNPSSENPIEIRNTISYYLTDDGDGQWIILGAEPHES